MQHTRQYVVCQHCGMQHTGICPRIKTIEYFPDGTIKRVEYHPPQPVDIGTFKVGSKPYLTR